MAQYSYVNGVYGVTTYVRSGFERFHTMNAQCAHEKFYEDGRYFERWHFISYATPICSVLYDSSNDTTTYYVNRAYFDCSPSTSRQFNRWLRENHMKLSLYDIKYADRHCDSGIYMYDTNTTIVWQDSAGIERKF